MIYDPLSEVAFEVLERWPNRKQWVCQISSERVISQWTQDVTLFFYHMEQYKSKQKFSQDTTFTKHRK